MIPKNKTIAIVHPQASQKGWAITMMIFLGNVLAKYNKVALFTQSYDQDIFWNILQFPVIIDTKIKLAIKMRKSDYIFVWNSPMQFVGVLSKILWWSRAKVYWWHHHYPWYYEKNTGWSVIIKKYLEKLCLPFVDELIANSLYLSDALSKIYRRESYILTPVVEEKYIQYIDKNKQYTWQKIFSYWRWESGKNLNILLEVYESLVQKIPKLELFIWGIWQEQKIFQQQYKDNKNIHFLGYVDSDTIIQYAQKSDVFLFPSTIDSFWMSAVEAMALYLPVVGFSWKWLQEIIQNNKNWYLVDSKIEFITKTQFLLQNRKLNYSLGQEAKKSSFLFSLSAFERQVWKIFLKKHKNNI